MSELYTWRLSSQQETQTLAIQLAKVLRPGDVIAVEGDLGAGKTTFAQGLAQGLDVDTQIDSPTFTIIKEYQGSVPFYHMDVYRLSGIEEELGLEEYLFGDGICFIEWAQRIEDWLPADVIWLHITVLADGCRQLSLSSSLKRINQWCKEVKQ